MPGELIREMRTVVMIHLDHARELELSGMRTYAAEGATVIVPAPEKAFEEVIEAPHTLGPDAQQKAMKPAVVQEVKDAMSLKDDTVEINLYNIPNPHVDGLLLAHVVKDNILWVTDLISPGRSAVILARLLSAMHCASTTSPAPQSPAVMAQPLSKRILPPHSRRTD
jgi:hypothetical protein